MQLYMAFVVLCYLFSNLTLFLHNTCNTLKSESLPSHYLQHFHLFIICIYIYIRIKMHSNNSMAVIWNGVAWPVFIVL